MKTSKKNSIFVIAIFAVIFISALIYFWHSQHKTSLIDLQKAILVAKTEADSQKVLDRLDKYYLTMSIPDSIRQHVQAEVDTVIKRQERVNPLAIIDSELDTNIYQVEVHLKEVLRGAIIARTQRADSTFHSLMQYAKILADTVDKGTDNEYWHPMVERMGSYNADQAMNWLMANRAERLCSRKHLTAFKEAEKYGALGLQLLSQCQDNQLQLDIIQRIQTILYQFHGMYDLSFALAKKQIPRADSLKYYLRLNGLTYNYAKALSLAGKNQIALELFSNIIERAEKYADVPYMSWYEINGLMGIGTVYWKLGQYDKALSICNDLEKYSLSIEDQIDQHITKGIANMGLGNFDIAESEYNKILTLIENAENISNRINNQIIALYNLGKLYYRLSEYDRANIYYNQAKELLLKYNPQNIELRCKLLLRFAETQAAQNKIDKFDESIQETENLIELADIPTIKAQLFRSLGEFNMNRRRYQQAYDNLQRSSVLYEQNGLLKAGLETKIDIVKNLVFLSKFYDAKNILKEIYAKAVEIQDVQRIIDAIGIDAEIAEKEGNLDKAIQISNRLIKEIEIISKRFFDIDNLTLYRQKIHDYLKNAVLYEVEKGRIDSAFIKLDYIKARALKEKYEVYIKNETPFKNFPYLMDIIKLKANLNQNQLIINYFVTENFLYAFFMDQKNLRLLKAEIKIENLKHIVTSYLLNIHNTVNVFQNHLTHAFNTYYDSTIALSQQLYEILLGWQEIQEDLQNYEIIYIIPDDILYEIPFSSLLSSINNNSSEFLINKAAIVYLPGAFFLQSFQFNPKEFDIYKKKILVSIDRSLPGADKLANFIISRFPLAEELIVDAPIIKKEDVLSKLNQKYEIYFFLGHSEADTVIPDSSFIELTAIQKANLMAKIIKISMNDIKRIDWSHAEMVFLIGCETAKGKVYKGTGLAGIQQGILTLGAKQVFASLWKIDANQANSQILEFFKSLSHKKRSAFALQDMQKKMIRYLQSDIYYLKPHPYFWGGFTLFQTNN